MLSGGTTIGWGKRYQVALALRAQPEPKRAEEVADHCLGQLACVAAQLPIAPAGTRRHRLAVGGGAGRARHAAAFTPISDHELHLEAIQPAVGRRAAERDAGEDVVLADALGMADGTGAGGNERPPVQLPNHAWRSVHNGTTPVSIHSTKRWSLTRVGTAVRTWTARSWRY